MSTERIKNINHFLLSDNWYKLERVTFDFQKADNQWETHTREVYDRGNGATILLYNPTKQTVILTRQFRMPTYLNGNTTGFLIEACAGLLDDLNPEMCIRKEAEEETGYKIHKIEKIFDCYMSPGSVTEILHFFVAEYTDNMKIHKGGGKDEEQEYIEVMEWPFYLAYSKIFSGEIRDAKTILLLQYVCLHRGMTINGL